MNVAQEKAGKKSFLSLLTDVPHLIAQLIRAELESLKAELVAKLRATGIGLALFVVSLSLLTLALLLFIFAGVFALALVVPVWASALIIGGITAIAAVVIAAIGAKTISRSSAPLPTETVDSIREDLRAIRGEN